MPFCLSAMPMSTPLLAFSLARIEQGNNNDTKSGHFRSIMFTPMEHMHAFTRFKPERSIKCGEKKNNRPRERERHIEKKHI